jgi:GT2 family glycosyltransferase
MSKPDLSIIIVNWKVRALLEKCLDSILQNKDGLNLEIIVVDNDSKDGTSEMIMVEYADVTMIALPKNIGFAAANNLALKQASSDLIFLLNPDTEINPGFFGQIKEYMDNNPQVAIVGPKIFNPDGTLQFSIRRSPTLISQLVTLLKLQNILSSDKDLKNYVARPFLTPILKIRKFFSKNKIIPYYLAEAFDYNKEQSVEQIMGAAMVIRRSVFDKIGFFDEGFFIWFEEVDFCNRALKKALTIKYFPMASIIHYGGESFSQKNSLPKQLIFDKSLLYYFLKQKPFWQFLVVLLLVPINILLTLIYVVFIQSKDSESIF